MNETNALNLDGGNKASIRVIGVGGGGGNATKHMIAEHVQGVDFVLANTDIQALRTKLTNHCIQLGRTLTKGLGAGSDPAVGRKAAEESSEQIKSILKGARMVFVTAGMGGGTGTGAAPVIAKIAHSMGILTVGVVTLPFKFEGPRRKKYAEEGLQELKKNVDTYIVVNNNRLLGAVNRKTSMMEAFKIADDVLRKGIQGITDLIEEPGYVNLDFADVTTVMKGQGAALMGIGTASGHSRIEEATKEAIASPLLEASIHHAKQVLLNISGGPDLTLSEAQEASDVIKRATRDDVNIIFGTSINKNLNGKIRVTIIATGITETKPQPKVNDQYDGAVNTTDTKQNTFDYNANPRYVHRAVPHKHHYETTPPSILQAQRMDREARARQQARNERSGMNYNHQTYQSHDNDNGNDDYNDSSLHSFRQNTNRQEHKQPVYANANVNTHSRAYNDNENQHRQKPTFKSFNLNKSAGKTENKHQNNDSNIPPFFRNVGKHLGL